MSICHYTITTGHARQSERSEVAEDVLAALRPLLETGTHEIPHTPGYSCRVTVESGTLAATVLLHGAVPLVTLFVASSKAERERVLALTGTIPARHLPVPVAIVEIHGGIAAVPDSASWLGDFERCLAWAWIDRVTSEQIGAR